MTDDAVQGRAPGASTTPPPRPTRSPAAPAPSDRATQMFLRDADDPDGFVFAMPNVMMGADNLRSEIIRDGSDRHGWIRMTHEAHGRRYVGEGPTHVAATLAVLADKLGYVATIVDKIEED